MQVKLLLLSVALAPGAFAAEADYCVPAPAVRSRVDYCYQNSYFVDAADRCLEKFDQDVLAHRNSLAKGFVAQDAKSVSAQNSKFRNSGADLSDTNASLGDLVRIGKQLRQELVIYENTLIFVNDAKRGFLLRFGLLADHQRDPCYYDNHLAMDDRIAKMDQRLADLQRTDAKTESLAVSTGKRRTNLDVQPSRAAHTITHGVSQGAARPVPSGTSRNPASTITGRIEPDKIH